MATTRPRSHISKSDMEASKLVFVFVKDAKPKRKSAVPIPDGYTWAEFIAQVKQKLKIAGVKELILASSGQKVTSLDELQDIDELCVVEGQESYVNGTSGGPGAASIAEISPQGAPEPSTTYHLQPTKSDAHKVAVSDGQASSSGAARHHGHDDEAKKYVRRANPLKRTLQRLFPSFFLPGLPVSSKDVPPDDRAAGGAAGAAGDRAGVRRRRKRSPVTLRNVLMLLVVLSCFATMVFFFFKTSLPAA